MKTSNRIIALLCTFVLIFSIVVVPASAANSKNKAKEEATAELTLTERMAQSIADSANKAIDALVKKALQTPNADPYMLFVKTEIIAQTAIVLITLLGVEVKCERVEYNVGGVNVWIDPLVIIPRDKTEVVVKP